MRTIYKYPIRLIDGPFPVMMPRGSEVLYVADQTGTVCIWALGSPELSPEARYFQVYGTGHPFDHRGGYKHIGSVQQLGGALVWHVFEVGESSA